jgi:ribosomal protein S18 acetylase RimI-like enzyme
MIDIEQARLEDLNELVRLFEAYRAFYRCELDADAARAYLGARLRNGESTVFLAWQQGDDGRSAVGFTQLYPCWASLRLAPSWVLYDLYVDARARRSGVAQALLERALSHARASGASVVTLETAVDNTAAQALYESTGWKRDNDFYTYYYDL